MILNLSGVCRQRRMDGKGNVEAAKRSRMHNQRSRAIPAPEANAELQVNLNVCVLNHLYHSTLIHTKLLLFNFRTK